MTDFDPAAFRRDLHAHPEVGFDLARTAGRIADTLDAAGLEVTRGVGGSGIVASLRRGAATGRSIGLRADMDALPIDEALTSAERPYASRHPGRFHGCGHDGHSTMLLGAALALSADPGFDRDVHFIFQPDEETGHGAAAMIADRLFERFPMSTIYGLHNLPGLPVGHFALRPGPFCAFEDNFEIAIAGRGGHSSMPEAAIDATLVAASLVVALQSVVARNVAAAEHAVVSVTGLDTDGARNVLASHARLTGDCRGYDLALSTRLRARIGEIAQGICAAHGATCDLRWDMSFRPLVNDADAATRAARAAGQTGRVDDAARPMPFSEDFAEFLAHRPGAFIVMGNGTDGPHARALHDPHYDFNDAALAPGIAYWTALARCG